MKYVMIEVPIVDGLKQLVPVIFPNSLVHADVAGAVIGALPAGAVAVSAGDCNVEVTATHGWSSTLQLSARASDARTISLIDYAGIVPT